MLIGDAIFFSKCGKIDIHKPGRHTKPETHVLHLAIPPALDNTHSLLVKAIRRRHCDVTCVWRAVGGHGVSVVGGTSL